MIRNLLQVQHSQTVELLRRYSKLPKCIITGITTTDKRIERPPAPPRRVKYRLDRAAIANICAQYQAGSHPSELAREYGIAKNTVVQLLIREGIPIRHRKTGLSAEQTVEAIQLYSDGRSLVQVGQAMGVSQSSVWDALKRAGVPMRSAHEVGRQRKTE